MTFSIVARCAYARASVGAVASQNVTDPALGSRTLDLMALGASADQAITALRGSTDNMEYRQVLAVDAEGRSAIHSGAKALGTWSAAQDETVACGGNLLKHAGVPAAMVAAFLASDGISGPGSSSPCGQGWRLAGKPGRSIPRG